MIHFGKKLWHVPIPILGVTATTVGEELKYNPRLTKSKEEFVQIMEALGLTKPSKMGNHDDSMSP